MSLRTEYSMNTLQSSSYLDNEKAKTVGNFPNNPFVTYSSKNILITQLYESAKNKAMDYCIELIEMNGDTNIGSMTDSLCSNFNYSWEVLQKFLEYFDYRFFETLKPNIDVDDDGEIIFEWYGRKSVRVNLTFGIHGELYLVSLFHGTSLKLKQFINQFSINLIKSQLIQLLNDKVA